MPPIAQLDTIVPIQITAPCPAITVILITVVQPELIAITAYALPSPTIVLQTHRALLVSIVKTVCVKLILTIVQILLIALLGFHAQIINVLPYTDIALQILPVRLASTV
jgi:hypothetical protein